MSYDFTYDSTDNVNFGRDSSLNNLAAATYILWIQINTFANWSTLFKKLSDTNNGMRAIELSNTVGDIMFTVRTASPLSADILTWTIPNYAADKWLFLACTYDLSAPSGQRINAYGGDLNNIASYVSQGGSGSGTVVRDDSDGDLLLGGIPPSLLTPEFKCGFLAAFNSVFTLAEIQQQQYRANPSRSDCVLFTWPGKHGITNVPDFSGLGNDGTATGCTLSTTGLPLGPPFGFDIETPCELAGISIAALAKNSNIILQPGVL